jgi:subtilisin family serine protease
MLGAMVWASGVTADPAGTPRGRMKGAVVFKLNPTADALALARLTAVLDEHGLTLDRHNVSLGHIRVKSARAALPSEETLAARIQASGAVAFAEPDYIAVPVLLPNDPSLGSQWFHTTINSTGAWDRSTGNTIVTAVCDTGVDPTHPDLQGNLLASLGWNTYLNTNAWSDINGHGTSVAGCIAAIGNNAVGVAGVAFNAKIIPIRVCYDSTGYAYYSDMADGIRYATDKGAKVVNLSYGGWYGATTRDACQYAWTRGTIVCVAAGNDGADQSAQAESDYMLLVGATDSSDAKASWSNYGVPVDFFAPGVSIFTTRNGSTYGSVSGTSFASPIGAGLAALLFGVNAGFTPAEVEDIVMATCVDLGTPGDDAVYGAGRINAAAAVALAAHLASNGAPVAVATAAPTTVNIGAGVTFDGTASYDPDGTVGSHAWTFGDGAAANGATASHAYAAAGTFTATLTVSDNLGATATDTVAITVVDPNVIATPTGLSASTASRTVTLRWTDNAANETGYYVERGTYSNRTKLYTWTQVATLAVNATTYSQTVAKGTWYYRVRAYSTPLAKTSAYSNMVKVAVK